MRRSGGGLMSKDHHWEGVPPDPDGSFGFIYEVTNQVNGMRYFGKKKYVSITRRKVAGSKKRKVVRKSNKWEFYTSSSKYVNADIDKYGKDNFAFTILMNCDCAATLHMEEIKVQVEHDVLRSVDVEGNYLFYNKAIAGIRFRPPSIVTKETRRKMSESSMGTAVGRVCSEETKAKLRESAKERTPTRLGAVLSEKVRGKIRDSLKGRYTGENSCHYNPTVHTFVHKDTGEVFKGTQYLFRTKYGLRDGSVSALVKGQKKQNGKIVRVLSHKGWVLLKEGELKDADG